MGHCLVVFTFVPVLAALPGWVLAEARNGLNWHDPIVLAFLPLRGALALLDGFTARVVPGGLAGLLAGLLFAVWSARGGRAPTRERRSAVGAGAGALGAALVLAGIALDLTLRNPAFAFPLVPAALELASGAVCGALAAPTALRYLGAVGEDAIAAAARATS